MLMVRPFLDEKETNEMLHSQSPWPNLETPEDVAKAVLVLASDAAHWMTGSSSMLMEGLLPNRLLQTSALETLAVCGL